MPASLPAFKHLYFFDLYKSSLAGVVHQIQIKKQCPFFSTKIKVFRCSLTFYVQRYRGKFFSPLILRGWLQLHLFKRMGRKRIKGTKYNRVTKQQKYVFLKLCITQKQSIHEAAFNAGIHYSTAKTILFFHKKQYKNYATYIVNGPAQKEAVADCLRAGWKEIPIDVDSDYVELPRIQIIANSKARLLEERMRNKEMKDSTSEGKDSGEFGVKLEYVEIEFPFQVSQNQPNPQELRNPSSQLKEEQQLIPKMEFNQNFFY